jgi:hypothetical protein
MSIFQRDRSNGNPPITSSKPPRQIRPISSIRSPQETASGKPIHMPIASKIIEPFSEKMRNSGRNLPNAKNLYLKKMIRLAMPNNSK